MTNKEIFQIIGMLPKLVLAFILFVLGWQLIGEGVYKLYHGFPHGGRDIIAGLAGSAPFSAGMIFLIYSLRSRDKEGADDGS